MMSRKFGRWDKKISLMLILLIALSFNKKAIKKSIPKPAHDDNELSADEDDDDEISLPSMSDSDDDDDGDDGDDDDDDEEGEELFRGFAGLSDEDEVEGNLFMNFFN